jgi:hypothetical protein
MKQRRMMTAGLVASLLLAIQTASAFIILPGSPRPWLDYWSFNDTNTWVTQRGYAPADFTNVDTCELGQYWTANIDSTNQAWLHYNITESDGTNHFTVDQGSVMCWFAGNWSGTNQGGSGPGEWGRLIEVGSYTTNAAYGWWSIFTDPEGANLYFAAQTNDGSAATYLSAPISWNITNRWHHLALTYSSTNTALYLDGELLTNGPGMTYWPGPDVLTNGFYIGSDSNGLSQAHGMFDELYTYSYPVDAETVRDTFYYSSIWYWANPNNTANYALAGSPSSQGDTPAYNAVTGLGNLQLIGAASSCVTNPIVWFTNVIATPATNGTTKVTFTIAGGLDGARYDVFANTVLGPTTATNYNWAWMGQGLHCNTYAITNLPGSTFLILGTPQDTDGDGLTDAYERLISHSNPFNSDTDGDGMFDGWEIAHGLNPLVSNQPYTPPATTLTITKPTNQSQF